MATRKQTVSGSSPFVVKAGSWLNQSSALKLEDGTQTWGYFKQPDLSPRNGDTTFDVTRTLYPQNVAQAVYGDSRLWWVIALANDMRLPFSQFAPGTQLRIPAADYVATLTSGTESPSRNR